MARNYWPYNDPANLVEQKDYNEKSCPNCDYKKWDKGQIKCKFGEPKCPNVLLSDCSHREALQR